MRSNRFGNIFRLAVVLAALSFGTGSAPSAANASNLSAAIVQTAQSSPPAPQTRQINIRLFGRTFTVTLQVGTLGLLVIFVLAVLLLTAILLALLARRRARQARAANRKLEQEIIQRQLAEDEIRKLNIALELRVAERTAQLQTVNRELEAFSYSVSHDLRAPLRHINGFSKVLLEDYADKLDDEGRGYLHEVRGASQEMAQLIDDVLQLARVTRSEIHREDVNLSETARSVVAELRKGDAGRAVTIQIEEGLIARGDKRLLQIMLGNLLGNAWKFTSKCARAEIAFGREQEGGEVVYFVRDNGAGFDMAYADKLFGTFQRLHSTREFEGTGIGLATVQRIVDRHGGRVWADAAIGKGATFYFTIPDPKGEGA